MSPEPDRPDSPGSSVVSSRWAYPIDASMTAGRAVAIILDRLAGVMEESERGVIARRNEEFLHDYRVAIRRTRSALALFAGALPAPVLRKGRKFFKELGRRTTHARDLDVLRLELPGYVEDLAAAGRTDVEDLDGRIERDLAREYAAIRRWLDGKTYRRQMVSWHGDLERLAATAEEEPMSRCAAGAIRKAAGQTEALSKTLVPNDSGAALHRLRIRYKKLRYALEFASPLAPDGEIDAVLVLLKQLQDQLGEHQDLVVHARLIAEFCSAEDAAGSPIAVGEALVGALEKRRQRLRASIEQEAPGFEAGLAAELDRGLAVLERA